MLFCFDTAVVSGTEGTLRDLYAPQYAALSEAFDSPAFWHGFLVAESFQNKYLYTKRISQMAGASGTAALLQPVTIGDTNPIVTVAALAIIDRFG